MKKVDPIKAALRESLTDARRDWNRSKAAKRRKDTTTARFFYTLAFGRVLTISRMAVTIREYALQDRADALLDEMLANG